MKVSQIYELMNTVTKEVIGEEAVVNDIRRSMCRQGVDGFLIQ